MNKRAQYTAEEQAAFLSEGGTTIDESPKAKEDAKPEEPKKQSHPSDSWTNYQWIENALRSRENTARLAIALGYNGKDEAGKNEAFKYIASVLQEIKKTEWVPGMDVKHKAKDLTLCGIDSIIQAIIDAATFRLPIDGRKLAYLVKYGTAAQFQPGYKGFLYKLGEFYNDLDFTAEPVFDGDELSLTDEGGYQTYSHKRADPFQDDLKNLKGLITCLTYVTTKGVKHSKTATLSKAEIDKIRGKAKQDYIWAEWFIEKAKVAGLKRLCKFNFATLMGVQDLVNYDNEKHFVIDATPNGDKITPANSGADLSKLLEHQPPVVLNPQTVTTEKEKVSAPNN